MSIVSGAHRSALLAFTIGLGACGIQTDAPPEALDTTDHQELLNGTTSTTQPPIEEDTSIRNLYFVNGNLELEAVQRPYPRGTPIDDILLDLEAGPTEEEKQGFESGLQSLLAGHAPNLQDETDADAEGQVRRVLVDPEAGLRELIVDEPPTGRLIVKQIICTLTELLDDEVLGVWIIDGGSEPVELTDDAGEIINRAARPEDFSNCITGTALVAEAELEPESSPPESGNDG